MKYKKKSHHFLPFIVVLFTTTCGIFFAIDDAFAKNGFMDLPVSACSNNHSAPSDLSHPGNFSGRQNAKSNTVDASYVSNSHHRTIGINDDDPCIQETPLMKITLNSLIVYAIDSSLPLFDVIREIFIPPKA